MNFVFVQALNKKEHKNGACGSPESLDGDSEYQLTPRTEAKYNKIDEEFQMMMQRNQLNGSRVSLNLVSRKQEQKTGFSSFPSFFFGPSIDSKFP